jgi:hypothetical protein
VKGQPGIPRHPTAARVFALTMYQRRKQAKVQVHLPTRDASNGCPADGAIRRAEVTYWRPEGGFDKVQWWVGVLHGEEHVWCATRNLTLEILWLASIERMVANGSLSATQ